MDIEQVEYIHNFLVNKFQDSDDPISPCGIKHQDLLDSAVMRPSVTIGGCDAYLTVHDKTAALFHSLINNHCFHNGNKRTALLSALVYLANSGYWVNRPTDKEMLDFTVAAAAHRIVGKRTDELVAISNWFKGNSRKTHSGEHPLKLVDLKAILAGFDLSIVPNTGTTLDIFNAQGEHIQTILKKGGKGKEDYDKQYIATLRKKLKLTTAYGVDSRAFYGIKGLDDTLGIYMNLRHKVMRDLAKL